MSISAVLLSPPRYVDAAAYRETLERLRALNPGLLGTAHFPMMTGPEVGDFLDRCGALVAGLERSLGAHLEAREAAGVMRRMKNDGLPAWVE